MPISRTESLKSLISKLNRSEKRFFQLYVRRLDSNSDVKFLELFNLIEFNPLLDDLKLTKKLKLKSSQQYANLKRHLFEQILIALRIQHSDRLTPLRLHEKMDYMYLLKEKAMFEECLHFSAKCHKWINDKHMVYNLILDETVDEINMLRGQKSDIQYGFSDHSKLLLGQIEQLKILQISLKQSLGDYTIYSYAKNHREAELRNSKFEISVSSIHYERLTSYQKFLFHLTRGISKHAIADIKASYKDLKQAENFYNTSEELKGGVEMHHMYGFIIRNALWTGNESILESCFIKYEEEIGSHFDVGSPAERYAYFIYTIPLLIRRMIVLKDYAEYSALESRIEILFNEFKYEVPDHIKFEILYLKALVYASKGDYHNALEILNQIFQISIDETNGKYYCYARLLQIMCHYRLNNFQYVDNNLINLRKAFLNYDGLNKPVELSLQMLRKGVKAMNFGLKEEFELLGLKLSELRKDSYQASSFLLFNFTDWFAAIKWNKSISSL